MTATPPRVVAGPVPIASAAHPCHRSASRGPPATTTTNTPCIRPRISSVATVCSIVERNTELTRSAAPAAASETTATHSVVVRPGEGDPETPQAHGDRDRDPLARDAVQLPGEQPAERGSARDRGEEQAVRRPTGGSPNVCSAASGNTARGMPKAIATRSMRNETSSTLLHRGVAEPVDDRPETGAAPDRLDHPTEPPDGVVGDRQAGQAVGGIDRHRQAGGVDEVEGADVDGTPGRPRRPAARRSRPAAAR